MQKIVLHPTSLLILILCAVLSLTGCAKTGPVKPTPQATERILKLQGYDFDNKSFLAAIAASDHAAIATFIGGGIDVNARSESDGQTPLILAATMGDLQTVKKLLQARADPNIPNAGGTTALFRALAKNHDDVADAIVNDPRLDLNARGLNRVTALIAYVSRDREEEVRKLVERGADVKLQDADGDAALHVAARNGNIRVVELLVAKGADVNARNKVGGTPLMWTAVYGHEEATRFLLDHGADPAIKDEDGMTAADWAAKNNRDGVVALLKKK